MLNRREIRRLTMDEMAVHVTGRPTPHCPGGLSVHVAYLDQPFDRCRIWGTDAYSHPQHQHCNDRRSENNDNNRSSIARLTHRPLHLPPHSTTMKRQ